MARASALKTSIGHCRSAGSPLGSSALGKLHPLICEDMGNYFQYSEKSKSPKEYQKEYDASSVFKNVEPWLVPEKRAPKMTQPLMRMRFQGRLIFSGLVSIC